MLLHVRPRRLIGNRHVDIHRIKLVQAWLQSAILSRACDLCSEFWRTRFLSHIVRPVPVAVDLYSLTAHACNIQVALTQAARMQENRAARSRLDRLRTKVSGTVRAWWMSYQRALDQEPVQTKALTSCTGLFLADVIAQAAEPGAYDPMRTARMAAFGLLWHGISVRHYSRL